MKQLIVTIALVLLGVFIANTLILGDNGSLREGANDLAETMLTDIKNISAVD